MGNSPSNNNSETQETSEVNTPQINNIPKQTKSFDGDEAFDKIKFLSNEILEKYQDHFLDKGFCDKIAFVYKKKLNELDINVLRDIHNKMNGEDKDLKVMLQYIPQNDDRFFVDFFKDKLNEFFWSKGIKYNKTVFTMNGLQTNDLDKLLNSNLNYINPDHVKKILKTFERNQNQNQNQSGGEPPEQSNENNQNKSNFQQNLLKQLENLEEIQNNKNKIKSNENEIPNEIPNEISNLINKQIPPNQNETINIQTSPKQIEITNTQITNKENNNQESSIQNQKQRNDQRHGQKDEQRDRQRDGQRDGQRQAQRNGQRDEQRQGQRDGQRDGQRNEQRQGQNYKKDRSNTRNQTNKKLENTKSNQMKNNKKSKYHVPQWYKEPIDFCNQNNKSESCALTKSQLCKSITQNLIIRNNIIAVILTTIPQKMMDKKGNISYEGGICFQKFLNLEKGFVCLPFNYREISTKSISEALPELMKTSNFLDQKSCVENNGFYLKLSINEKETLKKRAMSSEEEFKVQPHFKANKSYLDFIVKLKNKYFESLNALIMILEKLKERPFVSNEMLNTISLETKNIIDEMYSYTNKYYVYALFALIQSDYIENKDPKAGQLNQIIELSEK